MITKGQLVALLKLIADRNGFSSKTNHIDADKLLLEYIDDKEVSETWKEIKKT